MENILTFNEYTSQAVYEGLFNKILGNGKSNRGILDFVKALVSDVVSKSKLLKKYDVEKVLEHIVYDKKENRICYDSDYSKEMSNTGIKQATCMPDAHAQLNGTILDDVPSDNLSDKEIDKLKKRVIEETRLGALYVIINSEKDDKCKELWKQWKRDLEYLPHFNSWGYDLYVDGRNYGGKEEYKFYKISVSITHRSNRTLKPYGRFNFGSIHDDCFYYPLSSEKSAEECEKKLDGKLGRDSIKN